MSRILFPSRYVRAFWRQIRIIRHHLIHGIGKIPVSPIIVRESDHKNRTFLVSILVAIGGNLVSILVVNSGVFYYLLLSLFIV